MKHCHVIYWAKDAQIFIFWKLGIGIESSLSRNRNSKQSWYLVWEIIDLFLFLLFCNLMSEFFQIFSHLSFQIKKKRNNIKQKLPVLHRHKVRMSNCLVGMWMHNVGTKLWQGEGMGRGNRTGDSSLKRRTDQPLLLGTGHILDLECWALKMILILYKITLQLWSISRVVGHSQIDHLLSVDCVLGN